MSFERLHVIWTRIALVPLSHGAVALAMVCAGAFALGLAAGLPAVTGAPSGGVAVGGLGGRPAPVTVSEHTGSAPSTTHAPSKHIQRSPVAPAPQPGGAGSTAAPVVTEPPLPPAEGSQPGYHTIPPWAGNQGRGHTRRHHPGWQPWQQEPGGDPTQANPSWQAPQQRPNWEAPQQNPGGNPWPNPRSEPPGNNGFPPAGPDWQAGQDNAGGG